MRVRARLGRLGLAIGVAFGLGVCPTAYSQEAAATLASPKDSSAWTSNLWRLARTSDIRDLGPLLDSAGQPPQGVSPDIAESVDRLRQHLAMREDERRARLPELEDEMKEILAEAPTDNETSKALRAAVELQLLSNDKKAFLERAEIRGLIDRADRAAKEAEARGDWLMSRELFVRLHALLEEAGTYKHDVNRLGQRLAMLMLYVPDRFWEMRNARLLAAGEDGLPPYNPAGNDFHDKLRSINETMILTALLRSRQHVEGVGMNQIVLGGLGALKTMVTTRDLSSAFPALGDEGSRDAMLKSIDAEIANVSDAKTMLDIAQVRSMLARLTRANDDTTKIDRTALLHEFGQGLMSPLDDFSAIIWPDELRRFQRNTQGRLVGIGVSIEFDASSKIRVVTPLDGTPAQRAGIRPGDIIKKVDGVGTFGMSLDQAVDLITGPANTQVVITIERPGADSNTTEDQDYLITRAVIDIKTVKGWKRNGPHEDDWDWFIDQDRGIGYVRLTQFTDTTTSEFDRAITAMKSKGLGGLILDLRFNPGGLLDQAVSIVQRFVDVQGGHIVMMSNGNGTISNPEFTDPDRATLSKTPVIVLVNENSASASEIVSGALRYYGRQGDIDCLVLGERSFGKGSVQNVWELTPTAMMKLTIQYYMLPDKRIIHRKPGSETWGVEPDLSVYMLPSQTTDALTIRRNADIDNGDPANKPRPRKQPKLPADEQPIVESQRTKRSQEAEMSSNPADLLEKGIDLQLETAVLLLKSKATESHAARAALGDR